MVKLIQYDRNAKTRTLFEAEMIQFDEAGEIIKTVINGKEFDREKIEELRKEGYVYFTYHLGHILYSAEDYESTILEYEREKE